jgi:hypothetical protein
MKKLIVSMMILFGLLLCGPTTEAADYVTPKPLEGYTYLSEAYDKSGNCLVFIDATGNDVCDLVAIFFLHTGSDGKKILVPNKQLSCDQGAKAVGLVREQMSLTDEQPMIFDNDLGRLVNEQNRHI